MQTKVKVGMGGRTRAVLGLERGQPALVGSCVTLRVPNFRSNMSLLRLMFGALSPQLAALFAATVEAQLEEGGSRSLGRGL